MAYSDPFINLPAEAYDREAPLLTLADIDEMFPETRDGSVYSDLYKDVYGCRPRYVTFPSLENFDADFKNLVEQLNAQMAEEEDLQARNFNKFVARIIEIRQLVEGISYEHAIEVLADAEDELEDMKFYGYERLEWHLDLKYGSIKKWLEAVC